MKLTEWLRNIWYAVTHANQLIEENKYLNDQVTSLRIKIANLLPDEPEGDKTSDHFTEISELDGVSLFERLNIYFTQSQERFPYRNYPFGEVEDIAYNHGFFLGQAEEIVDGIAHGLSPEQVYIYSKPNLYWRQMREIRLGLEGGLSTEQVNTYTKPELTPEQMKEIRASLLLSNNPSAMPVQYQSAEDLNTLNFSTEAKNVRSSIPAGRIDYLGFNGKVRESLEYHDEQDLIAAALQSNYCGEPMSITVYGDPQTGAHINTAWISQLDPPPQGFEIETYSRSIENNDSVLQEAADPALEEDYEFEM